MPEASRRLRWSGANTCVIPWYSTRLGDRSFHVAGPRLWNKLPASMGSSDSLCQFRRQLKTFLLRVSTLKRDIDIVILSVCLSVRPFICDVPVSDENDLTYCNRYFHLTIRQLNHCSFISIKYSQNSDGVIPCGGDKCRWGIKISRFSTNKSL